MWELEVAAKEGRFEDEGWRIRKDGSRFWASVIITAIRDDAGKLIGFGKVTRDFTERMRAQDALRQEITERREAQRRLYDSEKSLRQLSKHLLRTQDEERRRIGRELHDSLGQSLAAIPWYLDGFSARSGIVTTFEVGDAFNRLHPDSELALFRVLQESLTNIHRHSGSATAHIRLWTKEEMVLLEIKDRGRGLAPGLSSQDWI